MQIRLKVNGVRRALDAASNRTLLSALRDTTALTGTKYGCGEGHCGACTVLLDSKAVRACQITVAATAGKQITTIESLESNGALHPLQQAFIEETAMQ
jgi:aerobic-type carbon monoxide dehydrogenase small subunit (CoxS/CutS family)